MNFNQAYMGVIQRQGIKDSIVMYFSVAIGAVNALFIYPAYLTDAELGLFQWLVSWAMIVSPFVSLGSTNLVVRYFPIFRDENKKHNGFLILMLSLNLIGTIIFLVITWLGGDSLILFFDPNNEKPYIQQFFYYIIPLTLFISLNIFFINYIKNFLRIVIPTFFDTVFVKIGTAICAILLFWGAINLVGFINGIILVYALVTLGLIAYTFLLGQLHLKPDFSFLNKPLMREMSVFAFYGLMGSMSGGLLFFIDRAMIPLLIKDGFAANGIFTIVGYIGTSIDIPRKSLEKITAPVVAHSVQHNDWDNIQKLYNKSSINQLIAGCLLFLGIWLNLDSFFDIMPEGGTYRPWKMIVLTLGISGIIDMATGINSQIIAYSKYFRFNFYLALVLALLNVVFNYIFIKTFDLNIYGAALATLTSTALYNLFKYWFIFVKLKMQPFTWNTLWIVLISLSIYFLVSAIPGFANPFLDIFIKLLLIITLYVPTILYFRFSPDLNNLWSLAFDRAKKWLKL
ncbi:MAG: polysaccharide biosynthesis C-terminal domain-containing protein [Saprospiraceae bacterium]|nr:polysaccharide biosynthesis C-terminal domain-containing protein [Saprospiraceae bacterium]